jgi:hypothetical protein
MEAARYHAGICVGNDDGDDDVDRRQRRWERPSLKTTSDDDERLRPAPRRAVR